MCTIVRRGWGSESGIFGVQKIMDPSSPEISYANEEVETGLYKRETRSTHKNETLGMFHPSLELKGHYNGNAVTEIKSHTKRKCDN